jgi:hypothetical protein
LASLPSEGAFALRQEALGKMPFWLLFGQAKSDKRFHRVEGWCFESHSSRLLSISCYVLSPQQPPTKVGPGNRHPAFQAEHHKKSPLKGLFILEKYSRLY